MIISFTLYAAVIKRPITNKVSDLYWMAAQMQLTFNRLEMDVWRYRAGQITREETDKSYAIAYSKYRMFTRPSAVNTDLEKIEGFDQIKALLARIFQHPPRQWTQQDALELSRDMEEMRPLLADYGVKARYAENSLVAQQLRMVERHQTMYLLGLMCWLAFLGIFWFVLHRLAEIRRHSLQQQQVLEREQAARAALVQTELAATPSSPPSATKSARRCKAYRLAPSCWNTASRPTIRVTAICPASSRATPICWPRCGTSWTSRR
ncbi:Uncharacterised protein [Chromobacterium violaceum]|uniref:Histidine kinase n=1 Tax=Chromobacterium violaceum TaxID=536 RepID=A0A3S4LGU9_CHRVL|nr:Uncharacterised protein [Chromobacterium violaceum]